MIFDLSRPITNEIPCTFSVADKVPTVTFEEGDSHGTFFVTSRIDNLYSNAGTQIDFPGHLSKKLSSSGSRRPTYETIGEYPLERFVGTVAVLDFSEKTRQLDQWFDSRGLFVRNNFDTYDSFIASLQSLAISSDELRLALHHVAAEISQLTGILIYSGCGKYWAHEIFESWEYRYFYGPYFEYDAARLLIESNITLVGIDAFQIENPISNFRGDELPLMVNSGARIKAREQLETWRDHTNHEWILGSGIVIYESLNIPDAAVGKIGRFSGPPLNLQLSGLDDDGVARPYLEVE